MRRRRHHSRRDNNNLIIVTTLLNVKMVPLYDGGFHKEGSGIGSGGGGMRSLNHVDVTRMTTCAGDQAPHGGSGGGGDQ